MFAALIEYAFAHYNADYSKKEKAKVKTHKKPESMVKNGKQAMVLFSLSMAGMNQGLLISKRQSRTQRSTEPPPNLQEDSEARGTQSRRVQKESNEDKKCCKCRPIDADTIDIYARAVFPFTFAVVNVIYWVAYTM